MALFAEKSNRKATNRNRSNQKARVLTDKSVQRVQNSEINAYFLAEIPHAYVDGDVSARFFLNHLHNDANMSTGT